VIYIIILLIMTLLGSIAGYFLKKLSESNKLIDMAKSKYLYLGASLYLIAAVLNIYILRFLDYSVVLPMTSLTYIWTMLISYKFLNEKITYRKIFGSIIILCGTIAIGLS